MSRTSTTAFDAQTARTMSADIPQVSLSSNYAIKEYFPDKNEVVLKNRNSSQRSLNELVTYKFTKAKSIDFNKLLEPVNPQSSDEGFVFSIKDEFIQRTVEDDGTVHDDPCVIWLSFKTTNGANVESGSDVWALVRRLVGLAAPIQVATEGLKTETYAFDTEVLDNLLKGIVKPDDVS